jgi:hypothetical protein
MDRTVPSTDSEEIELYIRTYFSLLRTTADIEIRALEEAHAGMGSALHPKARSEEVDMSALVYSSLRLPPCMSAVERVVLGQSREVFRAEGIGDIATWEPVAAQARRRRSYFDGKATLACFIASRSDIDDLIPMLTAFQIEWNKLHFALSGAQAQVYLQDPLDSEEGLAVLAAGIGIDAEGLGRLRSVWGDRFWSLLRSVANAPKRIKVRLLAGSYNDYRRATHQWWENVERECPISLRDRPTYFVSSNTHSLVNLYTGFALRREEELVRFLGQPENADLLSEWSEIEARNVPSSRENFLYYALKKLLATPEGEAAGVARAEVERACGVVRVSSQYGFDVQAQVFELCKVDGERLDPRLRHPTLAALKASNAVLVNIDYPLGMAAYQILSYVATRVGALQGLYLLGKAATLNGVIGDVMIPAVVHDEHSQNTFLFRNAFSARDIEGCLVYGTVLDNQKAVSVRGTLLQNPRYMDVFYREGYTDIEMEAGSFLAAVYELFRPQRHPVNEIVNLYELPFDLGIIHYASDTPLSKGRNLGAGSLSYFGMDPTYASSLAIWRRVIDLEVARLHRHADPRPEPCSGKA